MVFNIVLYDEYFDIPLRGLLRVGSSILAFDACIVDEEPAEFGDRPGVYSRVRGFKCDDALRLVFEEKDAIFRKWRADFDEGRVDASTHPLYVDPRYQELSVRAGELFSRLTTPIIDAMGLMRVASAGFVFEPVHETSP